jgi:hypothetical protein
LEERVGKKASFHYAYKSLQVNQEHLGVLKEEFLFLKTLGMEPNADELQVRKGAVLEI